MDVFSSQEAVFPSETPRTWKKDSTYSNEKKNGLTSDFDPCLLNETCPYFMVIWNNPIISGYCCSIIPIYTLNNQGPFLLHTSTWDIYSFTKFLKVHSSNNFHPFLQGCTGEQMGNKN